MTQQFCRFPVAYEGHIVRLYSSHFLKESEKCAAVVSIEPGVKSSKIGYEAGVGSSPDDAQLAAIAKVKAMITEQKQLGVARLV